MASADSLNVEAQFTEPRTEILGIPFVELFNYPIDRRAVSLVAPAICRRHEVLPIGVENGRLVLAMADTLDCGTMDSADSEVPIVRFMNLLISQAIQDHASDIHIEPAEYDLRVRYRIDGVLHEMQRARKSIQSGVISRLKN